MRILAADIVRETAEKHGITAKDILGQCRRREYAWPRQEAMYRIFTECPHLSYPEIARRLGGRHHTTVLHGVRRHCERNGIPYYLHAVTLRAAETGLGRFHQLTAAYSQAMEAARVH